MADSWIKCSRFSYSVPEQGGFQISGECGNLSVNYGKCCFPMKYLLCVQSGVFWPEMRLGVTDGLRPEAIGQSQRLHRHQKLHRHLCRTAESNNKSSMRWMTAASAMAGLCTGLVLVNPSAAWAVWAWVSAVTGVWMLATDRHFWKPMCAALSINFWGAVGWIGYMVSFEVGVTLAALAIVLRGSTLLFPGTADNDPETVELPDVPPRERAMLALRMKEIGNDYCNIYQYRKALKLYTFADQLDPINMVYHLNMAAVYLKTREYDKCVECCDKAIRVGMGVAEARLIQKAHRRRARALEHLRRHEEDQVSLEMAHRYEKLQGPVPTAFQDVNRVIIAEKIDAATFAALLRMADDVRVDPSHVANLAESILEHLEMVPGSSVALDRAIKCFERLQGEHRPGMLSTIWSFRIKTALGAALTLRAQAHRPNQVIFERARTVLEEAHELGKGLPARANPVRGNVLHNLGRLHHNSVQFRDDPQPCFDKAIECYEEALLLLTSEFKEQRGRVLSNLGNVYTHRAFCPGDWKHVSRDNWDLAIESYRAALPLRSGIKQAITKLNLAAALVKKGNGEDVDEIMFLLQDAKGKFNLDEHSKCFSAVRINLGHALLLKVEMLPAEKKSHATTDLIEAMQHLSEALKVHPRDTSTWASIQVIFGHVYKLWPKSKADWLQCRRRGVACFTDAREYYLSNQSQDTWLLDGCLDVDNFAVKATEARDVASCVCGLLVCLVDLGRSSEAVAQVELSRASSLANICQSDQDIVSLSFRDLQGHLGSAAAAVYFYLAGGTYGFCGAFVVIKGAEPLVVTYKHAVVGVMRSFLDDPKKSMTVVSEALQMGKIRDYLREHLAGNDPTVVILPHDIMHGVPIDVLPISGTDEAFADTYCCEYAPSLRMWKRARDIARKIDVSDTPSLVAIQNPTKDLKGAEREVRAIASLYPLDPDSILKEDHATKEAFKNALGRAESIEAPYIMHAACHGKNESRWTSGLTLAAGTRFTVGDAIAARLQRCPLFVASACETGLNDSLTDAAAENIGLPSALLVAGVPCVVASLWKVNDSATTLLMQRFHEQLQRGATVWEALARARTYLRTVSGEAAACKLRSFRDETLDDDDGLDEAVTQDPYPYASPAYWASFVVTGCGVVRPFGHAASDGDASPTVESEAAKSSGEVPPSTQADGGGDAVASPEQSAEQDDAVESAVAASGQHAVPEPVRAGTRKALLVWSDYTPPGADKLKGCRDDVADVYEMLTKGLPEHLRFHVEEGDVVLGGPDATRQAFLDRLKALAAQTQPGDVVVVYYSGHGDRQFDGTSVGEGIWLHPDGDTRGLVKDTDLQPLVSRICKKTTNLTVIFDCCHAAGALRDGDSDAVSRERRPLMSWCARVPGEGYACAFLAACHSTQTAKEQKERGAFTASLTCAIRDNRCRLDNETWLSIMYRVRAKMLQSRDTRTQEPLCEGLVTWHPFGTHGAPFYRQVPVQFSEFNARWFLAAGQTAGIGAGSMWYIPDAVGQGRVEFCVNEPLVHTSSITFPTEKKIPLDEKDTAMATCEQRFFGDATPTFAIQAEHDLEAATDLRRLLEGCPHLDSHRDDDDNQPSFCITLNPPRGCGRVHVAVDTESHGLPGPDLDVSELPGDVCSLAALAQNIQRAAWVLGLRKCRGGLHYDASLLNHVKLLARHKQDPPIAIEFGQTTDIPKHPFKVVPSGSLMLGNDLISVNVQEMNYAQLVGQVWPQNAYSTDIGPAADPPTKGNWDATCHLSPPRGELSTFDSDTMMQTLHFRVVVTRTSKKSSQSEPKPAFLNLGWQMQDAACTMRHVPDDFKPSQALRINEQSDGLRDPHESLHGYCGLVCRKWAAGFAAVTLAPTHLPPALFCRVVASTNPLPRRPDALEGLPRLLKTPQLRNHTQHLAPERGLKLVFVHGNLVGNFCADPTRHASMPWTDRSNTLDPDTKSYLYDWTRDWLPKALEEHDVPVASVRHLEHVLLTTREDVDAAAKVLKNALTDDCVVVTHGSGWLVIEHVASLAPTEFSKLRGVAALSPPLVPADVEHEARWLGWIRGPHAVAALRAMAIEPRKLRTEMRWPKRRRCFIDAAALRQSCSAAQGLFGDGNVAVVPDTGVCTITLPRTKSDGIVPLLVAFIVEAYRDRA
eukprot:m.49979 g.49979  ORF g.49979 m.49979 type:complete len:2135 (+) comp15354_c0_seq1:105-6509(+)